MSDLISRSELIEILEDYENDDWNKNVSAMLPSVVDDCIDFIENMPTAYDIDKVVKSIKSESVPCYGEEGAYHTNARVDMCEECAKKIREVIYDNFAEIIDYYGLSVKKKF